MSAIGAVVLAAGMSTRMGEHKLLLRAGGRPLFHYAARAALAASLEPVVVVGGYRFDALAAEVDLFYGQIELVENKRYASGMASSLQAGIQAMEGRTDAAFVFVADQPLVPVLAIDAMVRQYEREYADGVRIIRPLYGDAPGHPVLFDAEIYGEFRHLAGDEGGRSIVVKDRSRVQTVIFANAVWGFDVDTPDDYERVRA
ncbi:nucleotidyltransferase family protein [Paenibacillus cymbidii]|uniref:nucleotidyltransferase family protein n=1 Tax=Paenibacillus cymbidii TaxID=1639034 RepID=UPI001081DDEC|nr:nucleotidyltransferase family protein [Paenibacillus cymbidii]